MILGVGVDLISIERIERAYRRRPRRFLERIFTARERRWLAARPFSVPAVAARFAGKEAVLKALGCGIGPASLHEVEILSDSARPPRVLLSGEAARLAASRGVTKVELSLTHDPPFAAAVAVALGARHLC